MNLSSREKSLLWVTSGVVVLIILTGLLYLALKNKVNPKVPVPRQYVTATFTASATFTATPTPTNTETPTLTATPTTTSVPPTATPTATPTLLPVSGVNILVLGVESCWVVVEGKVTLNDQPQCGGDDRSAPKLEDMWRNVPLKTRADMILLVNISPSNKITILSLPRDLWVYLPKQDKFGKITSAYAYDGLAGMVAMMKSFDIPIHHYVVLTFQAVEKGVDSVGGVDLDIGGETKHYNGEEALALARDRTNIGKSDFDRMRHQRLIAEAVLHEFSKLGWLDRSVFALTLWSDADGYYLTDLDLFTAFDLAEKALEGKSNIQWVILNYDSKAVYWENVGSTFAVHLTTTGLEKLSLFRGSCPKERVDGLCN